jgi:uncharacterized protein (DUF488 family)
VLFTIGHGTLPIDGFIAELAGADVKTLVDVRAFPHSRHNPQFGAEALEASLSAAGVEYAWAEALGGRRRPTAGSPNVALRNDAFRAYADYMSTELFWTALDDVLARARRAPTAIMCSETVWWRCHRRLIADASLLVRGFAVEHLMPGGKRTAHRPTSGVRVAGDRLIYDLAP